jgi:hypothetical protein
MSRRPRADRTNASGRSIDGTGAQAHLDIRARQARRAARIRRRPRRLPAAESVTDEKINDAILKGVNYLVSRFDEKHKLKADRGGHTAGAHALMTLALLHASQAISDERLNIHNPFMIGLLDQLKKYEIPDTPPATYARSLRAQALAFHYRTEDRSVLAADTRWLINHRARRRTATATPRPARRSRAQDRLGQLPTHSTACSASGPRADAGSRCPGSYWTGVQSHWERAQLPAPADGSTNGTATVEGTLSMTPPA